MTPRALLPAAAAALLASCAYFNGLYNANDLAARATKAEREGRPFEAQNYWGQAAVKAESVLARHPRSRWAEEARWLDGKALERAGNCTAALAPLQRTLQEARDPRRADDAALRLASCQEKLGDPDAAGLSVERLLQNPDPAIRSQAAYRAGATYRRTGRSEEAVRVLRGSAEPRARGELMVALADAGDTPAATALADTLLTVPDTLAPWGALLVGLGRHDLPAGSDMLDHLIASGRFPVDSVALWLGDDGARWMPRDTARALSRLEQAYEAAPARPAGLEALLAMLRTRVAAADDPSILDTVSDRLSDLPGSTGTASYRGRAFGELATDLHGRIDSLVPGAPQGDLRGFLLGEALRDSLGAPRLAAGVWRRVLAERPASVYAPKLLLAVASVGGASADSVHALLDSAYASNPYVHALQGVPDDGFRLLEDSLARFARTSRTSVRRPRVPRDRPAAGRQGTADQ